MPAAAYARLQAKFAEDQCVVLDGGVATELQRQQALEFRLSDREHWGFESLEHMPQAVEAVHHSYVLAGCDVVTTNTYGILEAPAPVGLQRPVNLRTRPLHWMDLARRSVRLVRSAIEAANKQDQCAVAFSIGGDVTTKDQLETIELVVRALEQEPPDLVLFETLVMLEDAHTVRAIELLLETGLPVWMAFRRCRQGPCGIHGQLWGGPEGDFFGRLARRLEEIGVGAILINCMPPDLVSGTILWLRDFTDLPLGVYPNLGRYSDPGWRFTHVKPDEYADAALRWRTEGAQILGGCCGVEPEHIAAMAQAIEGTRAGTLAEVSTAMDRPGRGLASGDREAESSASAAPWLDAKGRQIYPLPLPELTCEPDVFVPTQGSYLMWKYLYNEGVGKNQRCLDIGCGTGILAVQLALNGARHVTALDIQKAAVANTLTNAFRNGVADHVSGEVTDVYAFEPEEKYDIVVASLYQMPTDPLGNLSGHRPIDYWGRNLLDHYLAVLPRMLKPDGRGYFMQISLLSQEQTESLLRQAGFEARILDFALYQFTPLFLENLEHILRVEGISDAYHFRFRDEQVMVMYLVEASRKDQVPAT